MSVTGSDYAKQVAGGSGVEGFVSEFVQEQKLRFDESSQGSFEGSVCLGGLQSLDHLGGDYAQRGAASEASGVCDGFGNMSFPQPRPTETEDVAMFLDEAPGAQFFDHSGLELWANLEVEAVQPFDLTQFGATQAALQPAVVSGLDLRAKQAGGKVGEALPITLSLLEQVGKKPAKKK